MNHTHDQEAPPPLPPPSCLLTLDNHGIIHGANAAALTHWAVEASALIGKPLVELVSSAPSILSSLRNGWNWEQILLRAQPQGLLAYTHFTSTKPRALHLRIEPYHGATPGYIATLVPPSASNEDEPKSPPAAPLLEHLSLHQEIGTFDLDFTQATARYSPGWKRMLGYTDTELADSYETWLQLIHPEDSAAAPDHHRRRAGQTHRNFSVEMRLRHRDGHYHWVHCIGTQLYSAGGKLEQITGLQIDIHERKSCEEAALLSEERLHLLSADQQLAAFDLDFAKNEYWFSNGWKKLLPPLPQRRPLSLKQILPLLSSEITKENLPAFLDQHEPGTLGTSLAFTLVDAHNQPHATLLHLHRVYDQNQKLTRASGYFYFLPASPAHADSVLFAQALETLHEGIILTNTGGQITHLNHRAESLLARPKDAVLGQSLPEIFKLVHHDNRPSDPATITEAFGPGHPATLHTEHALHSNPALPPLPIVWSAHCLRSEAGEICGHALLFRDPQAMSLTPEELLEANRLENLGNLACGISHDFNNLLTTILGGISQARDNRDNSFLADSERACLAAKDLTRQLLATAKGNPDNTRQTLSIADLLRDAARLTRAGSEADLQLELPNNLAPIHVNRSQIQQVLQNLLVNSLHALPPRGGRIWMQASERTLQKNEIPPLAAGSYIEIIVRDNGCGIPPEHIKKIFDPFFTTKKNGTGLGLATVLQIIRQYSGEVLVTSAAGSGTTFTLYLPVNNTTQSIAAPTRRRATLLHGTGRILLMEDNPDISRITHGMLQSLDYHCDIAPNGEKAIELYESYHKIGKPYDIVLLDLTVAGGMGGEETFHQLRSIDPDVRAVAASGYDHSEIAERLIAQGFCGYLTKPYRVSDLANAIKDALGKTLQPGDTRALDGLSSAASALA